MKKYRTVLFLDTNSIHYLLLFINFAKAKRMEPIKDTLETFKKVIKNEYGNSHASEDFEKGIKLCKYLNKRCKKEKDITISYSPFSCMEYTCSMLKSKVIIDAVHTTNLDRFWNKLTEQEMFHRLLFIDAYADTKTIVNNISTTFNDVGIKIEDTLIGCESINEIFKIANKLLENVFFNIIDGILYANALHSQAEQFITSDGYLKRTIRLIHNPGGNTNEEIYFKNLQKNVKEIVAEVNKWNIEDIILPDAPDIGSLEYI